MASKKIHTVICPICDAPRQIPHQQFYAISRGITSEKCFKCSRMKKGQTNSGGFKKGNISWLKGTKGILIVSKETRKKMSINRLGKPRNFSPEVIERIKEFNRNRDLSYLRQEDIKQKRINNLPRGRAHHKWLEDRSKLKMRFSRFSYENTKWRELVLQRDDFKCRIYNKECDGHLEVHHILEWSSYPELRYQLNNGITLCHAHHPRKRAEVKRLAPEFQRLVSVSN